MGGLFGKHKGLSDKDLQQLGLDPAPFREMGELDLLKNSIKSLTEEEQKSADAFVKKALSDDFDFGSEIDKLTDSQAFIAFIVIEYTKKESIMGPYIRAHLIINCLLRFKEATRELDNTAIAETREYLKKFCNTAETMRKEKRLDSNYYNDLKALFGDVKYRFKVPLLSIDAKA